MSVSVDNQFDVLQGSPRDEGKDSSSLRSRKDDLKEQAYQAREGIKNKAINLKEQVVSSVSSQLSSGLEVAKGKLASVTGRADLKDKSTDELVDEASDEWETVKRKGAAKGKKVLSDAKDTLDANIPPAQKAQLQKGLKQGKAVAKQGAQQAQGFANQVLGMLPPQLKGLKSFIQRNNLQLPAMILLAIGSLWLSLTLIRLVTHVAAPSAPEFDIHSLENSKSWAKYHAGEYKDKAIDMRESLSGRVAAFLANHELDKIKSNAIDWKEIGMKRLGLAEPTYTEKLWGWMTGRPVTWQGRVESVLDLGLKGLKASAMKQAMSAGASAIKASARDTLGLHEPTMWERARNYITGYDPSLSARAAAQATTAGDYLRDTLADIRSYLPGGGEAARAAAAKAYAATHYSTLDKVKSGAEYLKNRVIHGAEEAAHIAQDRAQRAMDEAKYKTGL